MKKVFLVLISSAITGLIGLIVAQLILPPLLTIFNPTLDELSLFGRANVISWAGVFLMVLGIFLSILAFNRQYDVKRMILLLLISLFLTFNLLTAGSYIYIAKKYPEVITNTSLFNRVIKIYSYPTAITLKIGDAQPIWIISIVLFLIIFNISFLILTEGK